MINIETNCESGDYKVSFEVGAPRQASTSSPARINLEAGKVERGLLKLVLSLVELIRQLMEKQAIRRIENGTLSSEETENIGLAIMRIEETIHDLAARFDLSPADLNLDLGPLGRLM